MALASNALVTLAETKDHLDIQLTDLAFDSRIERYINAASEIIERHCQRRLLYAAYSVRRDGRSNDRIVLDEWPVVAVMGVWDDRGWEFQPAAVMDPSGYVIEQDVAVVLRGAKFSRGNQNVRVDFTAGYRAPNGGLLGPALPASLSYACLMTVEWLDGMRHDRRVGIQSKGKNSENVSYTVDDLPVQIRKLLEPFVRMDFGSLEAPIGNF